jgi:hypothetical protein
LTFDISANSQAFPDRAIIAASRPVPRRRSRSEQAIPRRVTSPMPPTPQNHLRQNRNSPNHFKLILAVHSSQQKYSALDLPQISGFISLSRLIEEGRTRRHERGSGMRWTWVRQQTTGARADGQAVWSWRPDAGAKFAKVQRALRMTGARKPGPRGELGVSR